MKGDVVNKTVTIGGKNGDQEVTVGVPTNSWSDVMGIGTKPSYLTAKALGTIGLGNITGVNPNNDYGANIPVQGVEGLFYNNPGQTPDSIVAAKDAEYAIGIALNIAKNFIPGYGIVSFAANLLSGKITPGQAVVGIASDRVAALLGIPASLFRAAIGGDYGNGIAGWATSALNSYVAKETKMDPRLTAVALNATSLPSLAKTSLSSLNVGPNFAGAAAGAFDSGLSSIGIGSGPATTAGNVPNIGMDTNSQVDNILNPGSIAPTTAPLSLSPTSSTTPATGNISSADTSRGLTMPTLMSPSSGLAYVGDRGGSKYTPYSQNLSQLSLSPTQDLAMNYGPISNATAAQDIAKMSALPFESAVYASGGPVRHFDAGSLADSTSTETQTPARTPQQQAAYEAMQQNLQYYKDLGQQKQNDQIMSGLRALAGVGALEATPEKAPAREPLMRLGQTGTYTPPKVLPQLAALLQSRGMRLAEGGQPDDHQHPNYDGTPVFRTGGLSGLGGKYVEGKGDGTSDDITAMLANGEYVFSADVVSALGNGSNKAGAKELDQMVQAIRSRARSAPPDKLPPDAKSPLEYLKSKGKNHGTN